MTVNRSTSDQATRICRCSTSYHTDIEKSWSGLLVLHKNQECPDGELRILRPLKASVLTLLPAALRVLVSILTVSGTLVSTVQSKCDVAATLPARSLALWQRQPQDEGIKRRIIRSIDRSIVRTKEGRKDLIVGSREPIEREGKMGKGDGGHTYCSLEQSDRIDPQLNSQLY